MRLVVLVILFAACRSADPDELVRAVNAGDAKAVARLLENGADPKTAERTDRGNTVLCLAAMRGDLPVTELLLRHKADPRQAGRSQFASLPIMCASSGPIVRALVAAGADVEGDRGNERPLALACQRCNLDIVDALLASGAQVDGGHRDGEGFPGLGIAATNGHMACVQRLLAAGAVVDRRDQHGNTALMNAVIGGRTSIVRLLLERDADPLAANRAGHTPAFASDYDGRKEMREILRAAGVTDFGLQTPPALPPGQLIRVPVTF